MRKAGELINAYLREGKLAANRTEPIGAGGNAVVYASDVPGNVMKQLTYRDEGKFGLPGDAPKVIDEANLQAIAAEMGIAPRLAGVETFPGGIGNRIEMADVRGVDNRHNGNVLYNKQTGRPMQIDFGIAGRVEGSEQVATLANVTAEGFEAAGLGEVASIYRATVMDLLEGGDVADAMDVAKQGFSRLQKIK